MSSIEKTKHTHSYRMVGKYMSSTSVSSIPYYIKQREIPLLVFLLFICSLII